MIRPESIDEYEGTLRDLAPDLTPMLDVIFILLIFFILTANGSFRALDLTLPQKGAEQAAPLQNANHIVLEIHPGSAGYRLDDKTYNAFPELQQALRSKVSNTPDYELVIAGDKEVTMERLLEVLTFLQAEGIEAANILMQKKGE